MIRNSFFYSWFRLYLLLILLVLLNACSPEPVVEQALSEQPTTMNRATAAPTKTPTPPPTTATASPTATTSPTPSKTPTLPPPTATARAAAQAMDLAQSYTMFTGVTFRYPEGWSLVERNVEPDGGHAVTISRTPLHEVSPAQSVWATVFSAPRLGFSATDFVGGPQWASADLVEPLEEITVAPYTGVRAVYKREYEAATTTRFVYALENDELIFGVAFDVPQEEREQWERVVEHFVENVTLPDQMALTPTPAFPLALDTEGAPPASYQLYEDSLTGALIYYPPGWIAEDAQRQDGLLILRPAYGSTAMDSITSVQVFFDKPGLDVDPAEQVAELASGMQTEVVGNGGSVTLLPPIQQGSDRAAVAFRAALLEQDVVGLVAIVQGSASNLSVVGLTNDAEMIDTIAAVVASIRLPSATH